MKQTLKLEALGLLSLFTGCYYQATTGSWTLFLALFFVPDLSFLLYLVSKKAGTFAYNLLHHQGLFAVSLLAGIFLLNDWVIQLSLIFLAHSAFDRVLGYGLKYTDSFDHTHLGWIGKSRHKNIPQTEEV